MSRSWEGGSTRRWRALRSMILLRDGHVCQVPKGAGICGERATHVDHIRSLADGGDKWDPTNLRAACAPCNLSRGTAQRAAGPTVPVHVLIGPPGAGKTQHVLERAHERDVVLDLDRIADAISIRTQGHAYGPHVRHVAIGMRAAGIRRAVALAAGSCQVWIIHAVPAVGQLRQYVEDGWRVTVVDPGPEIVRARIQSSDRLARHLDAADAWYSKREQLLAQLQPMEDWTW